MVELKKCSLCIIMLLFVVLFNIVDNAFGAGGTVEIYGEKDVIFAGSGHYYCKCPTTQDPPTCICEIVD